MKDITVTVNRNGWKVLSTVHKGYLAKFRYSADTSTRHALKHFRSYLKTL